MATVVVTEDNEGVQSVLRDYLEIAGFEAVCFTRAEDAAEYLAEHDCAACVVDIRLPGMSGYDLYRRIRDLYPDVDVIVTFGADQDDDGVERLLAEDPHGRALKKPFPLERLVTALEAVA